MMKPIICEDLEISAKQTPSGQLFVSLGLLINKEAVAMIPIDLAHVRVLAATLITGVDTLEQFLKTQPKGDTAAMH